jgi:hypothetical protein
MAKRESKLKVCEWCLEDFKENEISWVLASLHTGALACDSCISKYKLEIVRPYLKPRKVKEKKVKEAKPAKLKSKDSKKK